MKTTMKKTAAFLLVMLLVFQMLPALADDPIVSKPQGPITSYREKLKISSETSTLTVDMKIQLTVTDNYDKVKWSSQDEEIATVDEDGWVTGVAPGQVRITATDSGHSDSITIRVVGKPAEESGTASDEKIMVFINGDKNKITYDGEAHVMGFTVTSNSEDFDESKLHLINGDKLLTGADCNVYTMELGKEDFEYDGAEEIELVITNGWLQIKPVQITIAADSKSMNDGDDYPEFTATAIGLIGDDTIDLSGIEYTVTEQNGKYAIVPQVEVNQVFGNYRVKTVMAGVLTVTRFYEFPLYNMAHFEGSGNYYRLAKTTIRTTIPELNKSNYSHILTTDEYIVDEYDFTDLVITDTKNKEYVYYCAENAEKIADGANYYTVSFDRIEICKQKIGGMNGSTPRWMVPEEQRYNDPNATDSIHRNFTIHTVTNNKAYVEQELFNLLTFTGEGNYYRLKKTTIKAADASTVSRGTVMNAADYYMKPYDFTDLVLTVDGEEYVYSDHELEGEFESYYTVELEKVIKENLVNHQEDWYNDPDGFLDGSASQYEGQSNKVEGYHANYKATLHKGVRKEEPWDETQMSITVTSSWPAGKPGYRDAKITLTAHLNGFDGKNYVLQWQHSEGQDAWVDVPGENGLTLTYTLNEETTLYSWRVVASPANE